MIRIQDFGKDSHGTETKSFHLKNEDGMSCELSNYGARIISLKVPDRERIFQEVVIGFPHIKNYLERDAYYGAVVGRYANRIRNGRFELDGKIYELNRNISDHTLHGGSQGFESKVWNAEVNDAQNAVSFSCISEDGENGFPGHLQVKVTYKLTEENSLEVQFEGATDKATVINLTQHAYFGFNGILDHDILDHQLQIFADHYLPVDQDVIATGEFREVKGTPFDFREPKAIGRDIDIVDEQLSLGVGYDHCFVLRGGDGLKHAASVWHPGNGRKMDVFTTEPGMQLYTANHVEDQELLLRKRCAFCLETQHFPNSPNESTFPSTVLRSGQRFYSETHFRFSVK